MSRILQNTRVIELGVSMVNNNYRDMGLAVAALAQEAARVRVEGAALVALTDSSAGTPDTTTWVLPVGTVPVSTLADGTILMAPKAGFDTNIATIDAAQSELETKINALMVGIATHRRISGLTAATNDTIDAITHLVTGVATVTCVDAVTALARLRSLRDNMSMLAAATSYCRIALGMVPLNDQNNGTLLYDTPTNPNTIEPVNTAASGTAVTTGAASLPEVPTENYLLNLKNQIATIAAAVNQMVNITAYLGGPFVVATSSPAYKFNIADVDFSS